MRYASSTTYVSYKGLFDDPTSAYFFGRVHALRRGHTEGGGAAALVQRSAHGSVPRCDCFGEVLLRLARPRLARAGVLALVAQGHGDRAILARTAS